MNYKAIVLFCFLFGAINTTFAQQITGYWHGKVGNGIKAKKLELKLVLQQDSIVGTSYYYESKNNFKRYSVKGHFNPKTNAVVWWDDVLLESKDPKVKLFAINELPYLVEADFNCPGGGVMMLDGNAKAKEKNNNEKIHLDKKQETVFDDEWNVVIDNWLVGGNNIALIDSIKNIAFAKPEYEKVVPIEDTKPNNNSVTIKEPETTTPIYKKDTIKNEVVLELPVKKEKPIIVEEKPKEDKAPLEFLDLNKPNRKDIIKVDTAKSSEQLELSAGFNGGPTMGETNGNFKVDSTKKESKAPTANGGTGLGVGVKPSIVFENIEKPIIKKDTVKAVPQNVIAAKFLERQKVILAEIPIADSIELHFYDNAEVDGDSISLFLNNQLLLEHIRLTDRPYIVKLNKEQLQNAVELTMVAENLGSIPPNTSYMVAKINGKQYTATLSSTEKSSAVIKFKKE